METNKSKPYTKPLLPACVKATHGRHSAGTRCSTTTNTTPCPISVSRICGTRLLMSAFLFSRSLLSALNCDGCCRREKRSAFSYASGCRLPITVRCIGNSSSIFLIGVYSIFSSTKRLFPYISPKPSVSHRLMRRPCLSSRSFGRCPRR